MAVEDQDLQGMDEATQAAEARLNAMPDDEAAETPAEGDTPQQEETPAEESRKYKIRHRDQEIEVSEDDLINYAEQGYDYQTKTTKHAETLREYEQAKPLLDMIRQDPNFARYLANYDQIRQQQGQGAANQYAAQQGVPRELQQKIDGMEQQLAAVNQQAITNAWEAQVADFRQANPEFDATDRQVEQVLTEVVEMGVRDPQRAMDLALAQLYRAQAPQLKDRIISNYTKTKTRQGPPVQGGRGEAPARGNGEPKTIQDAFASSLERIKASMAQGN